MPFPQSIGAAFHQLLNIVKSHLRNDELNPDFADEELYIKSSNRHRLKVVLETKLKKAGIRRVSAKRSCIRYIAANRVNRGVCWISVCGSIEDVEDICAKFYMLFTGCGEVLENRQIRIRKPRAKSLQFWRSQIANGICCRGDKPRDLIAG